MSVAQAIDVTVYGTIRDNNTQSVLENIQVKLYRNSAYYSQRYTAADGSYSFTSLPSGIYYIQAVHANYLTQDSPSHNQPDSTSVNISLYLQPKIVNANIETMTISGVNVMLEPYNVNISETMPLLITLRNTGNVTASIKLDLWSTQISLEPTTISTSWVSVLPNQTTQFNINFMVDSNYLNGTRDISLKIKVWDTTRTQSTVYPASYVEHDDIIQVTSYFKKAVVSLIDFDKPVYQPQDVANIAVKLQNNGEHGGSFSVNYYISDIPVSTTDYNGFLYTSSQTNIILQPGEELLLDRLQWTLPASSDNKSYYLFISVTSPVGSDSVQYDAPIVSFTAPRYRLL